MSLTQPVRPIALAVAALLGLAGSDRATASAADTDASWPFWRGPQRSGVTPEDDWVTAGKEAPLWSRDVGLGYSSPSIRDGRLYTRGFDQEQEADITFCLDAETGEQIWTHQSPARLWNNMHGGGTLTTPIIDADTLYVLSRMGSLFALSLEDGTVRWSREIHQDFDVALEPFGLSSSPVILDDQLILNVGKTLSLDKETGETYWETRDHGTSYSTPTPFVWNGDECLAVFNGTGLVIVDQGTGDELSTFPWTSEYNVNSASPIVVDDKVFISTGYNDIGCALLALADEKLEVVWQNRAMNNKMNGCVLYEDHLYGFDGGMLKCLNLDGEEQWRVRGLGMGTVIVAGQRLVVLSEKGELLIAPASPQEWQEDLRRQVLDGEGKCWTTPVLAGGLIYCRSSAGQLVCLDHRPPPTDPEGTR